MSRGLKNAVVERTHSRKIPVMHGITCEIV